VSEDLEQRLAAAREQVRELSTNWRSGTMQARRAALEQQHQAERDLAAVRGEPYATVIDIGPPWDAGAPLPHLISNGSRAFAVCRASQPDPDWDGTYARVVSSADPRLSVFVVIEMWGCAETRFGGPNDEATDGHPLYGKGLVGYEAHEVVNSAWIEEAIAVNSVHPDHSDAPFRQLHHYALLFHDEMLEVLARGIQARYVTGTMRMILGDLCDELVEQSGADLPGDAGKASDRDARDQISRHRNWLICARLSGRAVRSYAARNRRSERWRSGNWLRSVMIAGCRQRAISANLLGPWVTDRAG
jgi:hypothetical protein